MFSTGVAGWVCGGDGWVSVDRRLFHVWRLGGFGGVVFGNTTYEGTDIIVCVYIYINVLIICMYYYITIWWLPC